MYRFLNMTLYSLGVWLTISIFLLGAYVIFNGIIRENSVQYKTKFSIEVDKISTCKTFMDSKNPNLYILKCGKYER